MGKPWTYKREAVWWNTVLATAAAFVAFLPALGVGYAFVWLQDLLAEGYIGERGEGIGWFMRGVQYAIASAAAVWFPHLLFRSSNATIAATVLATALIGFGILSRLIAGGGDGGLTDWLEWIASLAGIGIGAGMAAVVVQAAQQDWGKGR